MQGPILLSHESYLKTVVNCVLHFFTFKMLFMKSHVVRMLFSRYFPGTTGTVGKTRAVATKRLINNAKDRNGAEAGDFSSGNTASSLWF